MVLHGITSSTLTDLTKHKQKKSFLQEMFTMLCHWRNIHKSWKVCLEIIDKQSVDMPKKDCNLQFTYYR